MTEFWLQIIVLIGSNLLIMVTFFSISAAMIWYFRKDAKEDWVRMEVAFQQGQTTMAAAMKESQTTMAAALKDSQTKTDSLITAIQDEMKDFHRRSLEIEYSIKERLLNLETRGQLDQKPKLASSKKE